MLAKKKIVLYNCAIFCFKVNFYPLHLSSRPKIYGSCRSCHTGACSSGCWYCAWRISWGRSCHTGACSSGSYLSWRISWGRSCHTSECSSGWYCAWRISWGRSCHTGAYQNDSSRYTGIPRKYSTCYRTKRSIRPSLLFKLLSEAKWTWKSRRWLGR